MTSTLSTAKTFLLNKINPAFDRLDQIAVAILKKQPIDEEALISALKVRSSLNEDVNPADHIQQLRTLLTFILIKEIDPGNAFYSDHIQAFSLSVLSIKYWREFQLADAYHALCQKLLYNKSGSLSAFQLNSGAAPLNHSDFWSWANVPHQINHAELGLIWALLGAIRNDTDMLAQVEKLAHWQTNLLNQNGTPLQGILTQELQASTIDSLIWSYLLYLAAGTFLDNSFFIGLAEIQKAKLQELPKTAWNASPLTAAIEQWIYKKNKIPVGSMPPLKETIYDPELGLVGRRTAEATVISTICGGRTGLGTFFVNDRLSVVTFGPQHLPLGECQAFGIESQSTKKKKFENFSIEQSDGSYSIKGYAKIPGKESSNSHYANYANSSHSEYWIEVTQTFNKNTLDIEVTFLSYDTVEGLSFTFFVRADQAAIKEKATLQPKSLEKYKGDIGEVSFTSEKEKFRILPKYGGGGMELIPLAGDDNFWGGDFLLGFSLNKESFKAGWTIVY